MPPGDCEFIVNCEFIKAEDNNNIFAIIVFTLCKQEIVDVPYVSSG